MQSIDALGWTSRLDDAFAPHRAAGLEPARVALEHTHIYRVLMPSGEGLARVVGRLRHAAASRRDYPAVGDWVGIKPTAHAGRWSIHVVLPRTSQFVRKVAGHRTEEQVVAANVDTVFLVAGLDGDFNPRRLERYLILAWESGAQPVVILNKADVTDGLEAFLNETARVAAGVPVHATSTKTGLGFDMLSHYLTPGRTVAFLGSSGVGKSSIINRLVGQELLRTREVRESDSRGRHTTPHRELVALPGGALVIDTPGMREIQLWDVHEGLTEVFEDIQSLAAGCRFRDCGHRAEPGCAVRGAVEEGTLDAGRLGNYLKLQDEIRATEARVDERAQQEAKRYGKVMSKALKKIYKDRDR
ncbi:MAG: ribosome small subunit-dependent GTPase A [Vicinamibacterales bacterium]